MQPITVVSNKYLVAAYMNSDASPEDKELARYLVALDDEEYTGALLRLALREGSRLEVYYPGLGQKAPEGAREVCVVPDGALYLVPGV